MRNNVWKQTVNSQFRFLKKPNLPKLQTENLSSHVTILQCNK